MAKKHHITLRQEFDEHDGPGTMYIVVTDNDFPIRRDSCIYRGRVCIWCNICGSEMPSYGAKTRPLVNNALTRGFAMPGGALGATNCTPDDEKTNVDLE